MSIYATAFIAALLVIATPLRAADTTWIEGTISSVTKQPLFVSHVLLFTAQNLAPMPGTVSNAVKPRALAIVAADSNGHFKLATTELGHLVVRIVAPNHAPLERNILSSGGHTIRLVATLATQFTPANEWDSVSYRTAARTYRMKAMGKGQYGASFLAENRAVRRRGSTVPRPEPVVRYQILSYLFRSNIPVVTNDPQQSDDYPDESGEYWSTISASKFPIKIVVDTKAWPRSNDSETLTFLSTDDATLDTLMRIMIPPVPKQGLSPYAQPLPPPTPNLEASSKSFRTYADRSARVREVAALAYGVGWDTLHSIVRPTSMAWTIREQKFFDLLLKTDIDVVKRDYADSVLRHHPVRRIILPLSSAAIFFAKYKNDDARITELLADMMREFPTDERTASIRQFFDPNRPIQVDRILPDFEWMSVGAKRHSISQESLVGAYTVFFVWDSLSQQPEVFDEFRRIQTKYQSHGLRIISIFASQSSTPPASLVSFVSKHPWNTVYSDGSPQSPAVFLDQRVPSVILVGPDKEILMVSGNLVGGELEQTLDQRLSK